MPTGLKSLLSSEKALFAIALAIAATVLAALGKMTVAEWKEYTLWVLGIYTSGKTIQGAAAALTATKVPGIATSPDAPPAALAATPTDVVGEILGK
jgi:hypothetical protein